MSCRNFAVPALDGETRRFPKRWRFRRHPASSRTLRPDRDSHMLPRRSARTHCTKSTSPERPSASPSPSPPSQPSESSSLPPQKLHFRPPSRRRSAAPAPEWSGAGLRRRWRCWCLWASPSASRRPEERETPGASSERNGTPLAGGGTAGKSLCRRRRIPARRGGSPEEEAARSRVRMSRLTTASFWNRRRDASLRVFEAPLRSVWSFFFFFLSLSLLRERYMKEGGSTSREEWGFEGSLRFWRKVSVV